MSSLFATRKTTDLWDTKQDECHVSDQPTFRIGIEQTSLRTVSTVLVLVGAEKACFHVHSSRLFAASSWFEKALTTGFKESDTQTLTLPEVTVTVFDDVIRWLYDGPFEKRKSVEEQFTQLAQLYAFAEAHLITKLKNAVVFELLKLKEKNCNPPLCTLEFAVEFIPPESIFQQLMVDWLTFHPEAAGCLTRTFLSQAPEFSSQLVLSLLQHRVVKKGHLLEDQDKYYEPVGSERGNLERT